MRLHVSALLCIDIYVCAYVPQEPRGTYPSFRTQFLFAVCLCIGAFMLFEMSDFVCFGMCVIGVECLHSFIALLKDLLRIITEFIENLH